MGLLGFNFETIYVFNLTILKPKKGLPGLNFEKNEFGIDPLYVKIFF
jgi:hypothetical protein